MIKIRSAALLFFTIIMLGNSAALSASDTLKIKPSVSADFVSRYVWRGQLLSTSPAIQPTLDFTLGSFSLGSWASYTLSPDPYVQEADLNLTYANDYLSVTIYDYYFPFDSLSATGDYFNWENSSTSHLVELSATLSGIGNIPLSLTAGVFLYGDDKDDNDDNYFSTYLELGYSKTLGETEFSAFLGGTLNEGYYASKAAIVNAGINVSREIEITDRFSLPVSGSFIVNPDAKNVFFVFTLSL